MRMLSQSWNWPGVAMTFRCLTREPSLLLPHATVRDFGALDFPRLRRAGVLGVVLDKDNTLTAPYADEIEPSLLPALKAARDAFGPTGIVVLSNSAGTPDDIGHAAANALERSLGLPVLRRRHKKPRGFESVRSHFGGCEPGALLMVGDRLLTDVTFGNAHGMLTVHTTRLLSSAREPGVVRLARCFERFLADRYRRRGVRPPPHPLAAAVGSCFDAATCAGERIAGARAAGPDGGQHEGHS
jgi:phosphatidylglycerophosphatase GEP4